MSYLIDSDWVADALAGRASATALLTRIGREGIALSVMTFGEIYEGVYYSRDPRAAEAGFRRFLRGTDVLPLTRSILRVFARIRGDLRRQGQLIRDPDLLIAATAVRHDLVLVTRNRRDFARIPNLSLYDP